MKTYQSFVASQTMNNEVDDFKISSIFRPFVPWLQVASFTIDSVQVSVQVNRGN